MNRQKDPIALICRQWARERPDLNTSGLEVVGRILVLAKKLDQRANRVLRPLGLNQSSFDVLATLRRQGRPYEMTPTELARASMLTSGAMTTRLDRLEEQELIRRKNDPKDRRGVRVFLTTAGRKLVEQAIRVRLDEAIDATTSLGTAERKGLSKALSKLLLDLLQTEASAE